MNHVENFQMYKFSSMGVEPMDKEAGALLRRGGKLLTNWGGNLAGRGGRTAGIGNLLEGSGRSLRGLAVPKRFSGGNYRNAFKGVPEPKPAFQSRASGARRTRERMYKGDNVGGQAANGAPASPGGRVGNDELAAMGMTSAPGMATRSRWGNLSRGQQIGAAGAGVAGIAIPSQYYGQYRAANKMQDRISQLPEWQKFLMRVLAPNDIEQYIR